MLKIIGGQWRGRNLRAPEGREVRPTLGRARQALFDLLGQRCDGWVVLDLFAGSGAAGLEALSRGADRAVFAESAPAALKALRANIEHLEAGAQCDAHAGDAFRLADRLAALGPYDLVFADPPYGDLAEPRRQPKRQPDQADAWRKWLPGSAESTAAKQAAAPPRARDRALDARLARMLQTIVGRCGPEVRVVLQADSKSRPPAKELLLRDRAVGGSTFYFFDPAKLLAASPEALD